MGFSVCSRKEKQGLVQRCAFTRIRHCGKLQSDAWLTRRSRRPADFHIGSRFPMTSDRPKKTKQKTVLLALGWYDHRLVEGIAAYAAEHNWHIAAASVTQEFIVPWGWRGDGIL